ANNHLSPRVRQRIDGDDVLQEAYRTFFLRHARKEFDLAGRDELWALLARITVNKARKAATREQTRKRDVRREQSAGAVAAHLSGGMDSRAIALLAPIAMPSD